jgi:CRP-like cAMP-binding protein
MRPGIGALHTLPVFATLSDEQLAILNEAGDLARIGPNEDFLQRGAVPTELAILASGYVAYTQCNERGRDIITDVVAPYRLIGFAAAFMGLPSPTGARTITSVRLIVIPVEVLQTMVYRDPHLAGRLLDHALKQLLDRAHEIRQLKQWSASQRLAQYLLGLVKDPAVIPARIRLPYEKRFLAARIGCSQENLSRAFATLRHFGVKSEGSVVVIQDVAALQLYALAEGAVSRENRPDVAAGIGFDHLVSPDGH